MAMPPQDVQPELALLARMKQGDEAAFVYARYNDPRTGESIYRLASIKRAEPAAELFKVPDGYTVKGHERPRAAPPPQPAAPPG